ncbi:uncharacterized protein LOC131162990 [Malania oleifera]|uniref:uncharacterized protein LOC131162990 n=1 Tax=Malania oleifera TaxID=397392 RepID=UPI0025AE6DD4|nr:uncharacterized protein LOC131162990 [Malania oleifera]
MAAFSPKHRGNYHLRSISLPVRSDRTTLRTEEELNKLKNWEADHCLSAEAVSAGISGMGALYRCIQDLLNLPLTQKALTQHQHEKWVDEVLDGSVIFLDICSNTRDSLLLLKEDVRELQSALRRRKGGDFSIGSNIFSTFVSSRKRMKKETAKSLAALKQIDSKLGASPLPDYLNAHISAVVRALRKTCLITISVFRSLLLFLSVPVLKPKKLTKWSLVSRLVHRGVVACDGQRMMRISELESLDVALGNLLAQSSSKGSESEMIQSANKRLEALEGSIEGLENALECLFKNLINTRVSFLNILSQ